MTLFDYNVKLFAEVVVMLKKAFTLAEILLVMSIIAVILVLTVPTVIEDITEKADITTLQAVYKATNDAVSKLMTDERTSRLSFTSLFSDDKEDFFVNYINSEKICKGSATGCFADSYYSVDGSVINTSHVLLDDVNSSDAYYVILPNGASLGFIKTGLDSGLFLVDVNSIELPNTAGLDLFAFEVDDEGTSNFGVYSNEDDLDVLLNRCTAGTDFGMPCFARLVRNDWKIDY